MEYDQLPDRVRENVPEPPEPDEDPGVWGLHGAPDPTDIEPVACAVCGDDLFMVPHDDGGCWYCGAEVCWVNDWGEQAHGEYVSDPGAPEIGYNLALDEDDDASPVMCGYCEERFGEGNSIVVITPDGETFGVSYDGSVIRDNSPYGEGKHSAMYDAPDDVWEIISELVMGTTWVNTDGWRGYTSSPDTADGLTKVSGGWHSTLEQSDLSERINTLTSGDFHQEGSVFRIGDELFTDMGDAVVRAEDAMADGERVCIEPADLDCPVAVKFGRTSNVMSIGIDVYAPEDAAERVENLLDARAAPVYAGVK